MHSEFGRSKIMEPRAMGPFIICFNQALVSSESCLNSILINAQCSSLNVQYQLSPSMSVPPPISPLLPPLCYPLYHRGGDTRKKKKKTDKSRGHANRLLIRIFAWGLRAINHLAKAALMISSRALVVSL